MNTTKKLWIFIGILLLLSPLGVIIPSLFNSEGAWGEWGSDEIARMIGFMPEGMKRLGETWKAPLSDYAISGQGEGLVGDSMGYLLTGLIGVAITAGSMYLLARMVGRKNGSE